MMEDESTQILNFSAKIHSDYPEDRRRQFVVSYYLCDKTMSIYEMAVPNSGFRAGKFLQRMRVRNPETKQFFEPSSFYIGAKLGVSGRVFELTDAAPHTLCLMESHADEFPEADITVVAQKLGEIQNNLRAAFEAKDPRKTGKVPTEEAEKIFSAYVPKISKHATVTLKRAFDQDGHYSYGQLLSYLNL